MTIKERPYGIVYKIVNTSNNKVYIGQTIQTLKQRKKDHLGCIKRLIRLRLYKALNEYGPDSFEWSILVNANSKIELDQLEKNFIIDYKSTNKEYGYNMTHGGEGAEHLEESKKRISDALKGRRKTKKTRQLSSLALKGKYTGEKSSFFGKNHTPETKLKQSLAQTGEKNHNWGKKATRETRKKQSESNKGEKHWNHKKVINLDTKKVYISALEASKKLKIDNSVIGKCCKGIRKTAGGYRWQYFQN